MKKTAILILTLCLLLFFTGCSGNSEGDNPSRTDGRKIKITVGEKIFTATLADNHAADAFAAMLPLSLNMSEMNGNEKYYYLDDNLPTDSYRHSTVRAGDLLLYGADCVVLFYETFSSSYSYTRIGWIDDIEGLAAALGTGSVTVTFESVDGGASEIPSEPDGTPDESEQPSVPTEPENPNPEIPVEPENPDFSGETESGEAITVMYLYINGNRLEIRLAENQSAVALVEILKRDDILYTASDYGGFEKVGSIGRSLPVNHTQTQAEAGDVVLYQNDKIVLFYGSNSWSYTRIGKIHGYSAFQLRELLGAGKGDAQVRLSLI